MAYASRVIIEVESRYPQIEKEVLDNVFDSEKFHGFIYGWEVLVESDHKPLTAISKKNLGDMLPRLQCIYKNNEVWLWAATCSRQTSAAGRHIVSGTANDKLLGACTLTFSACSIHSFDGG